MGSKRMTQVPDNWNGRNRIGGGGRGWGGGGEGLSDWERGGKMARNSRRNRADETESFPQ